MDNVSEAVIDLIIRAQDMATGTLTRLAGTMEAVGATATSTGSRIAQFGHQFSALGLAVGVGAAALAAFSIHSAIAFQTALTHVQAFTGASAAQIAQWRAAILSMAPTLGLSATGMAKGLYQIASAGISGASALIALKVASMAAAASHTNLTDTASALITAINAYHLSAKQIPGVQDDITQAVNKGRAEFVDLARSMGEVIPVAAAAHVGMKQLGAGYIVLTNAGNTAAESSIMLRNLIQPLLAPTARQERAALALGISHQQLAIHNGNLAATLEYLHQKIQQQLPDWQEIQQRIGGTEARAKTMALAMQTPAQAIRMLFGGNITAMRTFFALMNNGADAYHKALKEMEHDSGATAGAMKIAFQSTQHQLDVLGASLEVLGIRVGGPLLAPLTAILKPISAFIVLLSQGAQAAPGLTTVLLGTALAIGALSLVLRGLSFTFNPFLNFFGQLGNSFLGMRLRANKSKEALESLSGTAGASSQSVDHLAVQTRILELQLRAMCDAISNGECVKQLDAALEGDIAVQGQTQAATEKTSRSILGNVRAFTDWEAASLRAARTAVVSGTQTSAAWIAAHARMVGSLGAQVFSPFIAGMNRVVQTSVQAAARTIASWRGTAASIGASLVPTAFTNFGRAALDMAGTVGTAARSVIASTGSMVASVGRAIYTTPFGQMATNAREAAIGVKTAMVGVVESVVSTMAQIRESLTVSAFTSWVGRVRATVTTGLAAVTESVAATWNRGMDSLRSALSTEMFTTWATGVKTAVAGVATSVGTTVAAWDRAAQRFAADADARIFRTWQSGVTAATTGVRNAGTAVETTWTQSMAHVRTALSTATWSAWSASVRTAGAHAVASAKETAVAWKNSAVSTAHSLGEMSFQSWAQGVQRAGASVIATGRETAVGWGTSARSMISSLASIRIGEWATGAMNAFRRTGAADQVASAEMVTASREVTIAKEGEAAAVRGVALAEQMNAVAAGEDAVAEAGLGVSVMGTVAAMAIQLGQVALLTGAFGGLGMIVGMAAMSFMSLDIAMDANIIGLIILAIAALIAIIVLLVTHVTVIREAIERFASAIREKLVAIFYVLQDVLGFVKDRIGDLMGALGTARTSAESFTGSLLPVKEALDAILHAAEAVAGFLGGIFNATLGRVGHALDHVYEAHQKLAADLKATTASWRASADSMEHYHHALDETTRKVNRAAAAHQHLKEEIAATTSEAGRIEQEGLVHHVATYNAMASAAIAQARRMRQGVVGEVNLLRQEVAHPIVLAPLQMPAELKAPPPRPIAPQVLEHTTSAQVATSLSPEATAALQALAANIQKLPPDLREAGQNLAVTFRQKFIDAYNTFIDKENAENRRHATALTQINNDEIAKVRAAWQTAQDHQRSENQRYAQQISTIEQHHREDLSRRLDAFTERFQVVLTNYQTRVSTANTQANLFMTQHNDRLRELHDTFIQKLKEVHGQNAEKTRQHLMENYQRQVRLEDDHFNRQEAANSRHIAGQTAAFNRHISQMDVTFRAGNRQSEIAFRDAQAKAAQGHRDHIEGQRRAFAEHVAALRHAHTEHIAKENREHDGFITKLKAAFDRKEHSLVTQNAKESTGAGFLDKLTAEVNTLADNAFKNLDAAILFHTGNLQKLTAEVVRDEAGQERLNQAHLRAEVLVATMGGSALEASKALNDIKGQVDQNLKAATDQMTLSLFQASGGLASIAGGATQTSASFRAAGQAMTASGQTQATAATNLAAQLGQAGGAAATGMASLGQSATVAGEQTTTGAGQARAAMETLAPAITQGGQQASAAVAQGGQMVATQLSGAGAAALAGMTVLGGHLAAGGEGAKAAMQTAAGQMGADMVAAGGVHKKSAADLAACLGTICPGFAKCKEAVARQMDGAGASVQAGARTMATTMESAGNHAAAAISAHATAVATATRRIEQGGHGVPAPAQVGTDFAPLAHSATEAAAAVALHGRAATAGAETLTQHTAGAVASLNAQTQAGVDSAARTTEASRVVAEAQRAYGAMLHGQVAPVSTLGIEAEAVAAKLKAHGEVVVQSGARIGIAAARSAEETQRTMASEAGAHTAVATAGAAAARGLAALSTSAAAHARESQTGSAATRATHEQLRQSFAGLAASGAGLAASLAGAGQATTTAATAAATALARLGPAGEQAAAQTALAAQHGGEILTEKLSLAGSGAATALARAGQQVAAGSNENREIVRTAATHLGAELVAAGSAQTHSAQSFGASLAAVTSSFGQVKEGVKRHMDEATAVAEAGAHHLAACLAATCAGSGRAFAAHGAATEAAARQVTAGAQATHAAATQTSASFGQVAQAATVSAHGLAVHGQASAQAATQISRQAQVAAAAMAVHGQAASGAAAEVRDAGQRTGAVLTEYGAHVRATIPPTSALGTAAHAAAGELRHHGETAAAAGHVVQRAAAGYAAATAHSLSGVQSAHTQVVTAATAAAHALDGLHAAAQKGGSAVTAHAGSLGVASERTAHAFAGITSAGVTAEHALAAQGRAAHGVTVALDGFTPQLYQAALTSEKYSLAEAAATAATTRAQIAAAKALGDLSTAFTKGKELASTQFNTALQSMAEKIRQGLPISDAEIRKVAELKRAQDAYDSSMARATALVDSQSMDFATKLSGAQALATQATSAYAAAQWQAANGSVSAGQGLGQLYQAAVTAATTALKMADAQSRATEAINAAAAANAGDYNATVAAAEASLNRAKSDYESAVMTGAATATLANLKQKMDEAAVSLAQLKQISAAVDSGLSQMLSDLGLGDGSASGGLTEQQQITDQLAQQRLADQQAAQAAKEAEQQQKDQLAEQKLALAEQTAAAKANTSAVKSQTQILAEQLAVAQQQLEATRQQLEQYQRLLFLDRLNLSRGSVGGQDWLQFMNGWGAGQTVANSSLLR